MHHCRCYLFHSILFWHGSELNPFRLLESQTLRRSDVWPKWTVNRQPPSQSTSICDLITAAQHTKKTAPKKLTTWKTQERRERAKNNSFNGTACKLCQMNASAKENIGDRSIHNANNNNNNNWRRYSSFWQRFIHESNLIAIHHRQFFFILSKRNHIDCT